MSDHPIVPRVLFQNDEIVLRLSKYLNVEADCEKAAWAFGAMARAIEDPFGETPIPQDGKKINAGLHVLFDAFDRACNGGKAPKSIDKLRAKGDSILEDMIEYASLVFHKMERYGIPIDDSLQQRKDYVYRLRTELPISETLPHGVTGNVSSSERTTLDRT